MKLSHRLNRVGFGIVLLPIISWAEPMLQSPKTAKSPEHPPITMHQDEPAWEQAIGQVNLLAAKFHEYRDTAVAARSLAGLASTVCDYDKTEATVLFSRAMELVQTGLRSTDTTTSKQPLWFARAVVISSAAQCDPQFAEQLNQSTSTGDDEKSDPDKFWSDLRTANELLLTDQAKSVQFAKAVSQQIPYLQEVQLSMFYGFLWNLRQQSPTDADLLFLQALDRLNQDPASAMRALGVLGNYVFGPPGGENSDTLRVQPFGEADDYKVYFFQTQRAGATPAAMQGYLQTAAQVLSTVAPSGEKEAGVGYALAQQLVQRSLEVAPELAPNYQSSVERLSPLFPEVELRDRVSKSMAMQGGEYERTLEEELDKSTDSRQRDKIRLSLFAIRWAGREVLKAEKLAAAVEDDALRIQLLSLVAFQNAQVALTKRNLDLAQLHSRSLKSPLHRALVALGLAHQSEQQTDRESATVFLHSAIREMEKIDAEQRPYLLVCAATIAAALDVQFSLRILEDAIAGLNLLDAKPVVGGGTSKTPSQSSKSIFASGHGIVEFAAAGDVRRHFDLRIPGLRFDVPDAAKALRSGPAEHLTAALFSLQSEARQGPALAAAATAHLQQAKLKKAASSTE